MKHQARKLVQLSDSYNRSTNLELDFKDPVRLESVYASSKFQTGLKEILASVLEENSKHRVRVLSGSPGLGKSTFALFAAHAVSKTHPKIIQKLLKKTNSRLKDQFIRFQNAKQTKLLPVFLNGYEGEIEEAFIKNLRRSLLSRGLSFKSSAKSALKFYQEALRFLNKKGYGGIFAVYDEFGKYLERAVHSPSSLNIQFLQDFAEFCDRSGKTQCHLTLITHLSISQYARQLPLHVQREWAKIEGRFQESAFYDRAFDYYRMISKVFKKNISETAPSMARKYRSYIKNYKSGFKEDALEGFIGAKDLEEILLGCFPLHPASLALLPHLSMKAAQNERTLYTFLTRDENHSLKRFLDEKFKNEASLVMPFDLYQYFSPLIGRDVGIGGSYKIQLIAEDAFSRIDRRDEASRQIISLMALCSVIKNPRFAPLTEGFAASCLNQDFSEREVKKSLSSLRHKKIIFYSRRTRQHLLYEGSPVDIDEEIARLKSASLTGKDLVQTLKRYFKPDFIIPKKYNFDHAITRFYRAETVSVEELKKLRQGGKTADFHKEDGAVFYVIPFSHDELAYAKKEIQKIQYPLSVFVLPKQFIECRKDIEELNAVDCLYSNKELLSACPLAKKELDRHKEILLSALRARLKPLIGKMSLSVEAAYPWGSCRRSGEKARDNSKKSLPFAEISHFKDLQRYLGGLFEREYSKYTAFNLEYVNRRSVSGSVTLARKKFIDMLLAHKSDPSKNFKSLLEGKGPDYAIFKIMKSLSRFKFSKEENIYKISEKSDFSRFFQEYKKILSESRRIKGNELLDRLTAPPYGLRLGVIPLFAALADLCLKQPVSHYLDTAYVKDPDGDHYDLLMKYPRKAAVHYTPIDSRQQKFLEGLARIFGAGNGAIRPVIEALLKWRKTVPESTKQSFPLSIGAKKLLIQIDSSKEPDQLLFHAMPDCFGCPAITGRAAKAAQIDRALSSLEKAKKEIDQTYKSLLLNIKSELLEFAGFIEKQCLRGGFASLPGKQPKKHQAKSLPKRTEKGMNSWISRFQSALAGAKDYPLSSGASRFIGRALNFDASGPGQYFLETAADALTGSSPRHWDSKGYAKFSFALKKIKTEIELASEIAHPAFKGQSVLAFIERGADRKKSFVRLGACSAQGAPMLRSGADSRLSRSAEEIRLILDSFDEIDKRKIILAVLEKALEKELLPAPPHFQAERKSLKAGLAFLEGQRRERD